MAVTSSSMVSYHFRHFFFLFAALGLGLVTIDAAWCQEPEKVTACQLKENPAAYNHKLVEVTGFVSHGFEDFGLFDPSCPSWPYVWLEYGGTAKSGTMYCCGVTANRSRPQELVIEDISVPLVEDNIFHEFDDLIQRRPDTVVHATLTGRFFSGKEPKGISWGRGYGHEGCCALLAIQGVRSVDPHNREDLDYGASPDQPDLNKVKCGYRDLFSIWPYGEFVEAQHRADHRTDEWVFDDPRRVAVNALAQRLKIDQTSITGMKQTRKVQGRIVYKWIPPGKDASYMVVVSRPYMLLFYAENPQKIAWVVIAAYESSCDKKNSVVRLK
jgi:hypothetical protein